MTSAEFEQLQHRPCSRCNGGVIVTRNPNNNAMQVVCGRCAARVPWPEMGVINLKQTTRKRRDDYPMGEDLDEVWERFDDTCIVCGATKDELASWGVGRQRQHVSQYATDGHRGPIVPICTDCHPFATQLQKMRALLRHSRTHGELATSGRTGLPRTGLSSDPVRPEGKAPVGFLEGIPDDDADF